MGDFSYLNINILLVFHHSVSQSAVNILLVLYFSTGYDRVPKLALTGNDCQQLALTNSYYSYRFTRNTAHKRVRENHLFIFKKQWVGFENMKLVQNFSYIDLIYKRQTIQKEKEENDYDKGN